MNDTWVDRALGGNIPYVTYAVPFFFLLMGMELLVARLEGRTLFRLHDSITDLSCGVFDQLLGIFLKTALFAGYVYLFERWRWFDVERFPPGAKWAAALFLVLAVDFCFYWFHRFAHEWAAPWATHVVHHQSEEYNLAVALRQSALEGCFDWVFYLPLAVLGFPPTWYLAMTSINLIYQFWVHTRTVGRLGPLEWVLNTPSHHRVHHARNPKYLDKNYAGMLIVWDRLFGTFCAEEEEPVYGTTKPLASWNPLWAHLHVWVELAQDAWAAPYWWDKVRIWFMPLGWTPRGMAPRPTAAEVTPETVVKYQTPVPRAANRYLVAQFLLAMVPALHVMVLGDEGAPLLPLTIPSLWVAWTLVNLGGLAESRAWFWPSEMARLGCLPLGLGWFYRTESWHLAAVLGASVVSVASLAALSRVRRQVRCMAAAPAR